MNNPYETPSTELIDNEVTSNSLADFDNFSTWYVIGLTLITLGFYLVYWLYSRTKILNTLKSVEPIGEAFIMTTIVLYFGSFFSGFGELYFTDEPVYLVFSQIISIASNILFLVWVFKFKNRLNSYFSNNVADWSFLNSVFTFFFQTFYLSFKLNENIELMESNAQ